MHKVSEHIAYLVMHNDCVVVPRWGAFIASRQSARFDADTLTFMPPKREVAFNPDLTHNDGLLASSIVRSDGCGYDEALNLIEQQVAAWSSSITAGEAVTLDGVGEFLPSGGDTPRFVPQADGGVTNATYLGLQQFTTRIAEAESEEAATELKEFRPASMLIRVAASVAVVIAIVGALLTGFGNSESPLYTASLFGKPDVERLSAKAVEADTPLNISPDAELRIAMVAEPEESHAATTTEEARHYYLVVASLATQAEVDRYMASVPAADRSTMQVLHRDKRYRVYISSGQSFAEANAARNIGNNATKYPDAWVYVRK